MNTEKNINVIDAAFKYYLSLKSYGGSDYVFGVFLTDKCENPHEVYYEVLKRYKAQIPSEEFTKERNEPFKVEKNTPSHLFAKKLYTKILGSNRLF